MGLLGVLPEVAVLFIGNSYTYVNDVPSMVGNLSLSAGITLTHSQATKGGASLFQHGNASTPNGAETLQLLGSRKWDAVVLQDQSETAGGGRDTDDDLAPGVGRTRSLAALKDVFAPVLKQQGAKAVFYETWGRKSGDPPNADCGYGDFLSMNRQTAAGYTLYREALLAAGVKAASVARCGSAWETVYNSSEPAPLDNGTVFSCLYNSHPAAAAPGGKAARAQCIIDGMGLGGHPSPLGSFLNAATIFIALTGKSPVGLWHPASIAPEDAALAQKVALAVQQLGSSGPDRDERQYI